MFPSKTGQTSNPQITPSSAQAPGASAGAGQPFEFVLPLGKASMFYIDQQTGRRRLERLWLLQAFALVYVLIFSWRLYADDAMDLSYKFGFVGYFSLIMLVSAATRYFLKQKISFAKDQFASSVQMSAGSWALPITTKIRTWPELECIRFQKAAAMPDMLAYRHGRSDCLVLDWQGSKGSTRTLHANTSFISLAALSQEQQEKLFTCISLFVPQEVLSPEVLYLQVKTLSGGSSSDLNDYTHVWLEEYTKRFEISNYVTLAPGSKCGDGRFVVAMTIATKINSSTYLATTKQGEKVILKELVAPIDSDDLMQKKLLEQFNREAAILAKLAHPSIVSVIDHFIENGRSYIVMALAPGKNMREWVRLQGRLTESQILPIARQLASVLQYLHHHTPPILHRDFTPDNLMYGDDGTVIVVDFGAANVFNIGQTATLIGKQSYMPPEQLRGKPCPASDVYAFGATLSFLLTGKDLPSMGALPAFDGLDVSPTLASLIKTCTSFEFQDRPTCDQILQILQTIETSASTKQSPTPAIQSS